MATDNDTSIQAPGSAAGAGSPAGRPDANRAPSPWRCALIFAPIAVLVFAGCWVPVGSVDVWAHAAVGRWIVRHGHVPTHTLFLWTAHNPWIAHSWLTEVLLYALIRGKTDDHAAQAALFATTISALAAFLIVFLQWRRTRALGPFALLFFGMAAIGSQARFQPRAEMLSAMLYVLLLVAIDRLQAAGDEAARRKALLGIPLLVVAWVNLHGMFAFGLATLALAAASSFLETRFSETTRRLAVAIAIALLCSGVNPYGYRLWTVLFAIDSHTFRSILEWRPVWVYPAVDYLDLTYTCVLFLFAAASFAGNPRRRLFDILLLVMQAALLLSARRYIYFMCLTSLWVLGNNLAPAWRTAAEWLRRQEHGKIAIPAPATWLLSTVIMLAWIATVWPSGQGRWLKPATSDALPVDQANWILARGIKDNCLNDYDNASYLEWRFENGPLLATDALNAYPDSVQDLAASIWNLQPQGIEALDKVDVVLGRLPKPFEKTFPALDYALHNSPYWVEVFPSGRSGPIWLRLPPGKRRTRSNPRWISNVPNAPGADNPSSQ